MSSPGNGKKRKSGMMLEQPPKTTNDLLAELIELAQASSGGMGLLPPMVLADLPEAVPAEDRAELRLIQLFYQDFILVQKFDDKGQPQRPFMADPAQVVVALAGISLNSGLLPENVLFWGMLDSYPRVGIFIPPRVWPVAVRGQAEALQVPLPPLVFIGHRYDYSVWAVDDRPVNANAPVYIAPCPNTSPAGVCRGNAPFPSAEPATVYEAWEAFITSKFNRDLSEGKSRAYPKDILDQWVRLHQERAEVYPIPDLVRTNLTIGGLIKHVNPANITIR
jgi:hypothetical protein